MPCPHPCNYRPWRSSLSFLRMCNVILLLVVISGRCHWLQYLTAFRTLFFSTMAPKTAWANLSGTEGENYIHAVLAGSATGGLAGSRSQKPPEPECDRSDEESWIIVQDDTCVESSDGEFVAARAGERIPFDFGRSHSSSAPSLQTAPLAGRAFPSVSASPSSASSSSYCSNPYLAPPQQQFVWGERSRRHAEPGWRDVGGYTPYPGTSRYPRENARKKAQKERKKMAKVDI